MNFKSKILATSTALALVAGGWGVSNLPWTGLAHAKPEDTATAPVTSRAAAMPDFAALMRTQGPAVVNIRVEGAGSDPDVQGMAPPNEQGPMPFPFPFDPRNPNAGPREQGPRQAQGSGFIISPDGYVLTNAHVVSGGGDITVKLTDKREFKGKLIGSDPRSDVALVKIEASGLPHVRLGNPDGVQVGEWVAAIGSPFGFENTISAGIVSAKGRSLPSETYVPYIQTDAAVNPGNSGGPLFNLNGEVIGINSQIYSRTGGWMGLSFAIPIDIAMDVANQLRETGKVTRGRLGVQIQGLTQDLAKSFGLPKASGALVSSVEKGSPAQRAGVEPGDVILQFNGTAVEDSKDLPVLVARSKPGSDAKVTVWRGGKEQTLAIKVGELQPERVAAANTQPHAAQQTGKLGLAVQELPAEKRQELDVKGGVVVGAVQGPAARAGIQPGDVVLAVNGEQVESVKQFRGLVDKAASDRPLALLIQRGEARIYVPVQAG
jgi:serine protease Do